MGRKKNLKLFAETICWMVLFVVLVYVVPVYIYVNFDIDEKLEAFFAVDEEDTMVLVYNGVEYVDKDKTGHSLSGWKLEDELGEKITIEAYDADDPEERWEYQVRKYENDNAVDFIDWDGYLYCKKTLDLPDYKVDGEKAEEIIIEDEDDNVLCVISDKEEIACLMKEFVDSAKEEMWTEDTVANFWYEDAEDEEYYIYLRYVDVKPIFSLGSFLRSENHEYALQNYEMIWGSEFWKLSNESQTILRKYLG